MQPLVKHERTETKECVGLEQNSNEVAAVLSENARNEIAMNWSRSFVAQYFKKRPTICPTKRPTKIYDCQQVIEL
jgi:hypothetical protein